MFEVDASWGSGSGRQRFSQAAHIAPGACALTSRGPSRREVPTAALHLFAAVGWPDRTALTLAVISAGRLDGCTDFVIGERSGSPSPALIGAWSFLAKHARTCASAKTGYRPLDRYACERCLIARMITIGERRVPSIE